MRASPDEDAAVSTPPSGSGGEGSARPWSEEEELALRVWITLARCYFSVARVVGGKITEYGLTPPQFGVLEALYHVGPLALGELADKLLVTGGNVTYVMDRLEEQGLVRRERSDADRRVVLAHLTPEGRGLVADVFPGHAAFVREVCDVLDPGEQDRLRELLKKLGKGVGGEGC